MSYLELFQSLASKSSFEDPSNLLAILKKTIVSSHLDSVVVRERISVSIHFPDAQADHKFYPNE